MTTPVRVAPVITWLTTMAHVKRTHAHLIPVEDVARPVFLVSVMPTPVAAAREIITWLMITEPVKQSHVQQAHEEAVTTSVLQGTALTISVDVVQVSSWLTMEKTAMNFLAIEIMEVVDIDVHLGLVLITHVHVILVMDLLMMAIIAFNCTHVIQVLPGAVSRSVSLDQDGLTTVTVRLDMPLMSMRGIVLNFQKEASVVQVPEVAVSSGVCRDQGRITTVHA